MAPPSLGLRHPSARWADQAARDATAQGLRTGATGRALAPRSWHKFSAFFRSSRGAGTHRPRDPRVVADPGLPLRSAWPRVDSQSTTLKDETSESQLLRRTGRQAAAINPVHCCRCFLSQTIDTFRKEFPTSRSARLQSAARLLRWCRHLLPGWRRLVSCFRNSHCGES